MAFPHPHAGADLTVNRARVSGSRATRTEVARWLEAVPVASLGLGPEEILYVPRLRARIAAGERASLRSAGGRLGAELRSMLEAAERDSLTAPVAGRAYRFSSRTRYLAWLASLWLGDGSAAARAAFAAATGCPSLRQWQRVTVLRDGAILVPFAASLCEIGIAARWIETLGPADLALARTALSERFGLRLEAATAAAPVAATPSRFARTPAAAAAAPRRRATSAKLPNTSQAAVRFRSPLRLKMEAAAALAAQDGGWRGLASEPRQILLALITLARTPSLAGARHFAAELAYVAAGRTETPAAVAPPARLPAPRSTSLRPVAETDGAGMGPTTARPRAAAAGPVAEEAAGDNRVPVPGVRDPPVGATDLSPAIVGAPASKSTERLTSGYAGLLFLLNAFVALGLYPDFTERPRRRLDPSPLWLANRIGLYWFGAPYRRDPLCRWIREHAGGGHMPGSWSVEPDWVTGFGTLSAPRLVRHGDRATLWHEAGFPLWDGPAVARGRLRDAARTCGCRRRPLGAAPGYRRRKLPRTPAERWTACLALYLDARIRLAAGDPALGLSSLALAGVVRASGLDLTAIFRLDSHPIGLRIAGLDRDPGWQPAEGRSIGFRFE